MQTARCFVFFMALAAAFAQARSQDFMQEVGNFCLPVVDIRTVDGEEPSCDYVTHPEGAMGESIANATKVPARMCMTLLADTLYDSGEYEKGVSGLTVKIRGNTSAYWSKKPYKLKLQQKGDLLLRGDDATYEDKDWLLLPLIIYAIAGLKVNELVGMPYTPQYRFVNVCINGDYRGVYMLMESVDRNEKCRVDVAKEGGFIVELDPYWWNEDVCFTTTAYNDNRYRYTFKYPDTDDVDEALIARIRGEMDAMETSIADGTYTDLIDVESFAKWLLGQDILGMWDAGGSNRFFAKHDDAATSKIFIPCMWDFDSMAMMNDDWARIHKEDYYYTALFNSDNTAFANAYVDVWEKLSGTLFSQIDLFFANAMQTSEWEDVEKSLLLDQQRWNYEDCTLAEDAENVCTWLAQRRQWLSRAIDGIGTSIGNPIYLEDGFVYSLEGVCVGNCKGGDWRTLNLPKGIYIMNRKKVLVK